MAASAGAESWPDAGEEVIHVSGEETSGLDEGGVWTDHDEGGEEEDVGEPHYVEGYDEE